MIYTQSKTNTTHYITDCFYDSMTYMGEYDVTVTGRACASWYDVDAFMQGMPDGNVSLAGNKCRDPDG